ncbi:protein kinase [Strigomonas culicis]|nr:protein kinase [Strigomonas culicis]|eukprot:EPY26665.1 protein kinase [Strigomonas culicis]
MKQKYYTWEECVKLPEVDVVRKIHGHPNIVKLREVIRENNELFFVFEYMDGDLLGIIKKSKQNQKPETMATAPPIPYQKVKLYMRQLLQALAYIHKRGYFHRDLKPENLLIKQEGQEETIKLGDFGLVKDIRARPPFTDYVSTRWYRSPELLLQDRTYGPAVDIWAAACIMSELITTKPLFPGSNEVDQLFKIMSVFGSPTDKTWAAGMVLAKKIRYSFPSVQGCGLPKTLPSHIPAHALDLMKQMLIYDPKLRPTAEQCLQHPFFNVGVDESNGLSAAALDQLSNAARRLQQGPQSAPAGLQGYLADGGKEKTGKSDSLTEMHNNGSPQKLFTLGKRNDGNEGEKEQGSKSPPGQQESSAPTPPGMGPGSPKVTPSTKESNGSHLLNLKNVLPKSNWTDDGSSDSKGKGKEDALLGSGLNLSGKYGLHAKNAASKPANAVAEIDGAKNASLSSRPKAEARKEAGAGDGAAKEDVDLDNLMDEFATEMAGLGLATAKQENKSDVLPSSPSGGQKDVVSNLLKNARYKKSSVDEGSTPGDGKAAAQLNLKNAKSDFSRDPAKPTPSPVKAQAASPSIKALLAKYRTRT